MSNREVLELANARRLLRSGEGRQIRIAAQLSLAEVAETLGVSVPTLSRWERDERRPTRIETQALLDYSRLMSALRGANRGDDGEAT